MGIRNYAELSPYDFEVLIRDLLQAEWKTRLEVFPAGRDGGIDIRLFSATKISKFVQCKHSPGKALSGIKRSLQKDALKAQSRNLREFWIATSASLTLGNKKSIADLFASQDLAENRILAQSDIDNLLNIHEDVERSNYKLYLSSIAIIQRILRSGAYVRQKHYVESLLSRSKLFVQSAFFEQALRTLSEERYCLISGDPGAGKSTLADMMVMALMDRGYEPHIISEDISEVDDLWAEDSKQVFVYDDFLGQSSLAEKLRSGEDSRLAGVLSRVKNSESHLVIFTTREYILRAAQMTYARLDQPEIDLAKVTVDLSGYTRFQRAHILYNHLHFSRIAGDQLQSLVSQGGHRKIVDHRNFNPRLIELLIAAAERSAGAGEMVDFTSFALASLDDPDSLWRHILENQIGDLERDLAITLSTFPRGTTVEDLWTATKAMRKEDQKTSSASQLKQAMRVLEGVFFTIESDEAIHLVRFSNPGMADFVVSHALRNTHMVGTLASSTVFKVQAAAVIGWITPVESGNPTKRSVTAADATDSLRAVALRTTSLVETLTKGADTSRSGAVSSSWAPRTSPEVSSANLLSACAHKPDLSRQVVREIIEGLLPQWKAGIGEPGEIVTLLEAIWSLVDSTNQLLVEKIVHDFLDLDSSGVGLALSARFLAVLGEEAEYKEALVGALEQLDQDLADLLTMEDAPSVGSLLEQIEEQLEALNSLDDFEEQVGNAQQHLEELRAQDFDPDDYDSVDRHDREVEEGDVEDLFGSIRTD